MALCLSAQCKSLPRCSMFTAKLLYPTKVQVLQFILGSRRSIRRISQRTRCANLWIRHDLIHVPYPLYPHVTSARTVRADGRRRRSVRTVRADGPRGRSALAVRADGPRGRSARAVRADGLRGRSARTVRADGPRGRSARTVRADGPRDPSSADSPTPRLK